ncbi:MAG: hypothetical protein FIB04_07635 [Gammaproteobacteria bacterium]|nr:hypothetical protein [Gammaproteobacteria bacterium]
MSAALIALAFLSAGGCQTLPDNAMELPPDSLKLRQLQTRRVEGIDEKALLAASVGVLQDLGFNVDESETKLGVIVASKNRSAVDTADIATSIVTTAAIEILLTALLGDHYSGDGDINYDATQAIRISVVTRPALDSSGQPRQDAQVIRVTIQRQVWDDEGNLTHAESIEDPEVYQKFFDRLSKSIFLELQAN